MIGEYRFFQEFFDGQIVKEESEKYKMFKILLFSCFSALGLFLVFSGICNIAEFLLLEIGMLWNLYSGLSHKISIVFGIIVAFIYFFFTCNFAIYANGLIYVACYIPFQMMACYKDYSEGDFVQIRKKITDSNRILFFIFAIVLFVLLLLLDVSMGARFEVFDALSATLLVCSALLRNERYNEYYLFRIMALLSSILLWILVAVEYSYTGALLILLMYVSYLIYDVVNYFVQSSTYLNQYMVVCKEYQDKEDEKIVKEKLTVYKRAKKSENKNK